MKNVMDNLIEKIKKTDNPTVMGLDPRYETIPKHITTKYEKNINGACDAILEFNKGLIDATYDIIPAVKPNIAFYEMLGTKGIETFIQTCKYAKQKGMLTILDIKRGDIGSTAQAYSNAFLGRTVIEQVEEAIFDVEFVTVNPYLGIDGVKPFLDDCIKYNKGLFILVKTSNPSSGELQDLKLETGKTIYEKVGELVNDWGKELIGEQNYSAVGAVTGATYPEQLEELRKIMPNTFFLIPGYGAQGGKAQDIAKAFDKNGIGGIVNASRSLMYAYKQDRWKDKFTEEQYKEATRQEAIRMRDELNSAIKANCI